MRSSGLQRNTRLELLARSNRHVCSLGLGKEQVGMRLMAEDTILNLWISHVHILWAKSRAVLKNCWCFLDSDQVIQMADCVQWREGNKWSIERLL